MSGHRRLREMLDAYEDYRTALLALFQQLDISRCYAGEPRPLIAGLIVAELVGGLALPPPHEAGFERYSEVLDQEGRRIRVLCVSDRDGVISGGFHTRGDSGQYEELAIVGFVDARPVAAHLIPADRIEEVGRHLGDPVFPGGGLCVTVGTHTNLMLEPVAAAAYGVSTFDLLDGSA